MSEKVHFQKGNSPKHKLRTLKYAKCKRERKLAKENREVGLEAAIL